MGLRPLFLLGHYGTGWRGWARLNDRMLSGLNGRSPSYARPLVGRVRWEGKRFDGCVFLEMEHGHGDAFVMYRWIPEVRQRVAALHVHARPDHVSLLADQWPGVTVISKKEDPGQFDQCVLSYSLPKIFGVERPEDVARPGAYLRAVSRFRPLKGEFRVGIRWAGHVAHVFDLHRSTQLEDWAPVLEVPGVSFYSLQLDTGSEQLGTLSGHIEDLAPELTDWAATAAAMMELDLIISVDTSCAHLAGALSRPVWILLSAVPEWRWMLERRDTPWYGSARLYRQERCGDWSGVFAEVARDLAALA